MADGGERKRGGGKTGSINSEMLEGYTGDIEREEVGSWKLEGSASKIMSAPYFLIGLRCRTLSDFSPRPSPVYFGGKIHGRYFQFISGGKKFSFFVFISFPQLVFFF